MKRPLAVVVSTLAFAALPAHAWAQNAPGGPTVGSGPDWSSRGFVSISGGVSLADLTFSETTRVPIGGEDFVWTSDYEVKPGLAIDVSGGVRIFRRLVAAASFTRTNDSRPATISGSVPHPFYFGQPRAISGESDDLSHVEQTVHVSAMWIAAAGRHAEIGIFGGPSFVEVTRDFVSEVRYTEEYPYDEATFAGSSFKEVSERAVGFHVGADLAWLFTPTVGVGVTGRYTRAAIELDTPSGNPVDFDAGGFQIVGGVRLRFGARTRPAPATPTPAPPPSTEPARPAPAPGARPTTAQFPEGTVMQPTPVYLRPDASRTPLRQLPANMRVRILEATDEWLRVEFNDERLGRRVGYVRRAAVRIDSGGGD